MNFLIKSLENIAQFEGSNRIFGTGETPFISHSEDLTGILISKDKFKLRTGLSVEDIKTNVILTDEEKKIYQKGLTKVIERIKATFGEDSLDQTNNIFWSGKRTTLLINNATFSDVFDDDNIEDLIFRWQVIGGGYSTIAPSLNIAERTGRRFYLTGEDEFTEKNYEEEFGVKRKAIAALSDLLDNSSTDALVYITWNTVDANQGFNKNTPKATYEKILMEFIEGKHVKTGKKNCAKKFLDNYNIWKTDKEQIIGEAVINAAKYFGDIFHQDGKFRTSTKMTVLGSTIAESFDILMKPENHNEFKSLRESIDAKLNK